VSIHQQSIAKYYRVHILQKEPNAQKKKKIDSWATTGAQDKEG
jgi:hypothetical protein